MLILSFSNIEVLLKSTLFPGGGGDGKLLVWYYLLHYQLNFICNKKNKISAIEFRKFSIYYEHDCSCWYNSGIPPCSPVIDCPSKGFINAELLTSDLFAKLIC